MSSQEVPNKILVSGGAGFVGSATIRRLLQTTECQVFSFDKLTYAADRNSLKSFQTNPQFQFIQADVCDREAVERAFDSFQPDAVIHAAAETHVDRSIASADEFVQTNLVGTFTLLDVARKYFVQLEASRSNTFRFLHVSTDEVYGSLESEEMFTETMPYRPSSPYSASKAGSDHLALAWHHTYGLPVLVTHCSNNYGPRQFPEKLIPRMILNCLADQPLPVYGVGANIRDWLHVDDHAEAIIQVLRAGKVGQTYNIGDNNERTNLQVVESICQILDELRPRSNGRYRDLITFVDDRLGHDLRYSIDASKIHSELGWKATTDFETGLRATVQWYLDNESWWNPTDSFREFDK